MCEAPPSPCALMARLYWPDENGGSDADGEVCSECTETTASEHGSAGGSGDQGDQGGADDGAPRPAPEWCCVHGCGPECLDDKENGCGAEAPRRVLRRLSGKRGSPEGEFRDPADGQRFKTRKVEDGWRCVPQFTMRAGDWGREKGFRCFNLLLSLLGPEGKYLLWDTDAEMTRARWVKHRYTSTSKPPVRCRECNQVFETTSINSLQQGKSIGCRCNSRQANHWRDRRPEVVLRADKLGVNVLTPEAEWKANCTGRGYKPELECRTCGGTTTSTSIEIFMYQGCLISCKCHPSTQDMHWRDRRPDVVLRADELGVNVLTPEAEWKANCTGCRYKPKLECRTCGGTTTSTSIDDFMNHGCLISCKCHPSNQDRHWRDRRPDVVLRADELGVNVLTPEAEWKANCTGHRYKPELECRKCGVTVTTTSIDDFVHSGALGCRCVNKTEALIGSWLDKRYPQTEHHALKFTRESTGGTLTFDFHHDAEMWILELDGDIAGGHFDPDPQNDTPRRDLEKEEWALAHGYQVIRVLQEDVWSDQKGWDSFVATEIAKWNARRARGEPPGKAVHPDDPHYLGGVYADLRRPE